MKNIYSINTGDVVVPIVENGSHYVSRPMRPELDVGVSLLASAEAPR